MELQYGTVTSVGKNSKYGAQLCTIKAHLSNREYQNVEVITPKGMNYLPSSGDVVVFAEIHNTEVIVLGVLEAADISLQGGDIVIHRGIKTKSGAKENYNMKSRITLAKDFSITLETGDSSGTAFTPTASLKIKNDGSIEVSCVSFDIL